MPNRQSREYPSVALRMEITQKLLANSLSPFQIKLLKNYAAHS
jgi:hypothetical protein